MYMHIKLYLTVDGSSKGVSISACLKKTFPRQARHNIRSNAGILSRSITPATNLHIKNKIFINQNRSRKVF